MNILHLISATILTILCCCSLIVSQQNYTGQAFTDCYNPDTSKSVLGYTCTGLNKSCQTYLTFRSQPPYNTVPAISAMLASDPSRLAAINSVSEMATFETNRLVIVPINCSCSGQFYQLNTSHVVVHGDTLLIIANNTFQGLSTCQAMMNQSSDLKTRELYSGNRLSVPLRCACPTKSQTDVGINYLMTYIVAPGDFVSKISDRFGGDTGRTLEANGLSEQDPLINSFTTLLVPLQNPPSSLSTIEPPSTSPPPPSTPPASSNSSKKTWVYALVGAIGGCGLAFVIGIIIFCTFFRKSRSAKGFDSIVVSESFEAVEKPPEKKEEEAVSRDFLEALSGIAQSLKVYIFEELQRATDNFSSTHLIKGAVYRGRINGDLAAIKKMNGDVSKEINLLNKTSHSNLIRLSGVCFNEGHWYLVYEYAENGPLSDWIYYSNNAGKFLSWTQRIQIMFDVASGLNYLHSFTTPPHIHKDIKSSNILLDNDFRAKIANLGLARSTGLEEGEFSLTSHIVGTIGYMAPEYLENGFISPKLDVYAFGALMLEILTGKESSMFYEQNTHLADVLNSVLNTEDGLQILKEFVDPSMQESYPPELAMFLIRLIDRCLNKNPAVRPTMEEMVNFLSRTMSNSLSWELSGNVSGYQTLVGVLGSTATETGPHSTV